MGENTSDKPIRGFIFTCSNKTEEECLNRALRKAIVKIIEENNFKLVTDPVVPEITKLENGYKVKLLFETYPEIELEKEDYKNLKLKKIRVNVTPDDINRELEALRERFVDFKEVDKEAQEGDLVEIEYEAIIEGEEPQKGTLSAILGSQQLWPEVEEKIKGLKKGEEIEFEFKAPEDEKYHKAAGKNIKMRIKVLNVKEKVLPEVNDEFAKKLCFENLEKLKEQIESTLRKVREERAEELLEDLLVTLLIKKSQIKVPPSLVNVELQAFLRNEILALEKMGIPKEQIQAQIQTLTQKLFPLAYKTAATKLILDYIAEKENIEVPEEIIENEIKKIADMALNGNVELAKQIIEQRNLMPLIYRDALRQYTLDKIKEWAEIEEVDEEEFNKYVNSLIEENKEENKNEKEKGKEA
jgi:trigger factor